MSSGAPNKPGRGELDAIAAQIKLVVFDVDGVLTDGGLYYGPNGEAFKRFDVRDGHGIVLARLTGLPCAILTARRSEIVEVRARELGMVAVLQGQKDKSKGLLELCARVGVEPKDCAYMGDDVNDLAPMSMVALAACPCDAAVEVRHEAIFIARDAGGKGAARELIEVILRASGRWPRALDIMRGVALADTEQKP
jgi:3-deoxy-D-manno-octulosonate 8-phosphate phosphatase (KDO 8-P phosphatase)